MTAETPVAAPLRTWRWWGILRLAVVLVWLLAATTTWWTTPRKQSYEQARADVAAGRVTVYQWGDRFDETDRRRWLGASTLRSSGTLGPLFEWRTTDGHVRWTNTDEFDTLTVATTGGVEAKSYSGPGAVALTQELQRAGLAQRTGDVDSPGPLVSWLGIGLAVLFFGVLVAGPAPVRGTRWFWFWLVFLAAYGVGLLLWLALEHPWSRSATAAAEPGGRRRSGLSGFGFGILASLLTTVALLILHYLLGDWWVPHPSA
jgi:hypothetical protein